MRPIYLLSIGILILTSCKSLKNTTSNEIENRDVMLFNKGVAIFEVIEETSFDYELNKIDTTTNEGKNKFEFLTSKKEDILDFAFEQFEGLVEHYPNSKLYHKALYNLAHISSIMDYEDDEINYLKKILNSNANDKEHSGRSGIMANPYANYKNEASNKLTEIYINKGDYENALKYKVLNEKYPLQHFCGNAFAADEINNAQQYARIHNGLGETEKALGYLLPNIFNNGLASNVDLVKLTIETLKKDNDISVLKTKFNHSIENFYSRKIKKKSDEWLNYYIKYFNTEITIPSWNFNFEEDEETIKAEIHKTIKASEFYSLLQRL